MIDPTPLLIWDDPSIECLNINAADSAQARRLEILIGEATAAGQHAAVLGWLCDVGSALLRMERDDEGAAMLTHAVAVCTTEPIALEAITALVNIDADVHASESPCEAVRVELASWALCFLDGRKVGPAEGWESARRVLAAVDEAAGENFETAIAHCAEAAYARLFPKPDAAAA